MAISRLVMTVNWALMSISVIILPSFFTLDLEKLESLGIERDFYISDVVVYFNRVFLAVPRTVCRNNITHPTLVEVPWKEFNVILKSRMITPIDGQIWAHCDDLQDAISLAKEGLKSKLWILDRGNEFCDPKIVAFSMLHNTFLTDETVNLVGVQSKTLNSIVIENGTKLGDHRAFIANAGTNKIIVCYLKDPACTHVKLSHQNKPLAMININAISISEVNPIIYLTGTESLDVYSFEIESIDEEYTRGKADEVQVINVTYCGQKLGSSSGLETDMKNGLIYYLIRDYAVVRWLTYEPMQAEYHDVLAQSYNTMPYVSRIFTDHQGNIYALVNPFSPSVCRMDKDMSSSKKTSSEDTKIELLERVVKLMKYNRLLDIYL